MANMNTYHIRFYDKHSKHITTMTWIADSTPSEELVRTDPRLHVEGAVRARISDTFYDLQPKVDVMVGKIKTEFSAGMVVNHDIIKTVEGVLVPFMPQGESVNIDGSSYTVNSYGLIVIGNEIIAHVRLG
jgi:hypothetical protein